MSRVIKHEPRHKKTGFLHVRKQRRRSASWKTAKLISALVFATRMLSLYLQSLYWLNTKFLASSHLLWLYSPVSVGPGRKPGRPIFSQRGASYFRLKMNIQLIRYLCLAMSVGAVAATHRHQTSAPRSFYHYLQEKTRNVWHEIFDMKTQIQECCNPAG